MTPEQILADLRDIHLPETAGDVATVHLVLWPLLLVLLAASIIAWLIWRRRSTWRRDFFEDLNQIEGTAKKHGDGEGWAGLATLMKRLAIQQHGREDVAALNGEPWLQQLDDLIGSKLFTQGAGRGLITFPYLAVDLDDDTNQQRRDDLKTTIEALRSRLPRHVMAPRHGLAPRHGMTG